MDKIEDELQEVEPFTTQYRVPETKYYSGKKSKSAIIIVSIIVFIIVILSCVFLFISPYDPPLSNITVSLSESHTNHLYVTVLVGYTGRSSPVGEGDVEITYNDNVIYNGKIAIDDSGIGRRSINFNNFIEGNGAYYFQVKYREKDSPPQIYEVDYLVESLHLEADVGVVSEYGQLNLTTFMLTRDGRNMASDPKDIEYHVTEIRNLDEDLGIPTSGPYGNIEVRGFIREGYPYSRSGNYSISVKVTNTRAKPTSDYYEIIETRQIFLNILPVARGIVSSIESIGATYTADFDANASWNDGDITLYIWDFNNDGNVDLETKEPYASYSGYVNGMNYDAVLNVQGDVILDSIFNDVEKGAVRIPVNSP